MPASPTDDDPLYREAARRGERRVGDDAELYRRNRGIGGAAANDAPAAAAFRPRLGSTVTLFGREVALGFEHLSVLLVAGVLGGVEVAIGIVVLYLGYLMLSAAPPVVPAADAAGGVPRRGAPRPREPGLIGALKHFFGPLPEGAAVSAISEDEAAMAAAMAAASPSPSGGQVYSAPPRAAGAAPAPAPARSPGVAVGGTAARGDARAAAAAAAAARAAAAAAAQAESS